MTTSLLLFGFLLGLKHALEADHVAAVASLATRTRTPRHRARLAGLWGIGHAATILTVGGCVILLGVSLPPASTRVFECAVGVVLVALGADVLRRLRSTRVHFHVHQHDGAPPHFHAHAHAPDAPHDPAHHEHAHGLGPRALLVGSLHGLAGSAALVVAAAAATRAAGAAFAYLAAFAFGSVLGMVSLALVISIPLAASGGRLGRFQRTLEGIVGTATIALGAWMAIGTVAP